MLAGRHERKRIGLVDGAGQVRIIGIVVGGKPRRDLREVWQVPAETSEGIR